ncbi:MAG TPA: hypothetical protein PLL30_11495 [Candidatus Krumholzibacteria bacterium]|nr:hypothetical protein [Candidatus Krumholzibacteria bacterium]HPD72389.1 hypothetical protein [Candidatus Krumholzibacteria bacterium]HRY40679.1 hypothetical protein [Candidatus Krumholzibacteria bacterium]
MNGELRTRQLLRRALSALCLVIGVISALVTILDAQTTIRTGATLAIVVAALSLGVFLILPEARRLWRTSQSLPSNRELDRIGAAYRVEPATPDEIGWIADLQASVYSSADAVPESVLREWYGVNPSGFFIVRSPGGNPVGHLDVLPIRPQTLERFLDGDIVEREIRGDSLFPPADRHQIKHLYIESVILCPNRSCSKGAAMLAVLSSSVKILEHIAELKSVESIYAIAATVPGKRLLKRLGFELYRPAEKRRDGHDLFRASPALVAKRVVEVCGRVVADDRIVHDLADQGL